MAECSEISLMLGAFEDAELEPNEMQEVAYHLARCDSCSSILSDFFDLSGENSGRSSLRRWIFPHRISPASRTRLSRESIGCR